MAAKLRSGQRSLDEGAAGDKQSELGQVVTTPSSVVTALLSKYICWVEKI